MYRRRLAVGVMCMALAVSLSACGGDSDDDDAASTPTASSTATPEQPQGADGVTYEIQNWDDYADDPVVLDWKETTELVGASINAGKVLSGLSDRMSKDVLRTYVKSFENAWDNDWQVKTKSDAKIKSVETNGDTSKLVVCVWQPNTVLFTKDGETVSGKIDQVWDQEFIEMKKNGARWVLNSFKYDGSCSGGAPS